MRIALPFLLACSNPVPTPPKADPVPSAPELARPAPTDKKGFHIVELPSKPHRGPAALVELKIGGPVKELSVSPNGHLWLATEGKTFRSDALGKPWRRGSLSIKDTTRVAAKFDRISFFTPKFAIATGYIGRYRDMLYRTSDGGATWTKVNYGTANNDGGWIYDAFVNARGEGWIGGSGGNIYYTSDYGASWTKKTSPFTQSTRSNRIFMTPKLGVVGALDNAIKITRDAGKTWTAIPTPLDQKVAAPDRWDDDRIDNIAIYGDWIIVQQNDEVFARRATGSKWRRVRYMARFEVDRDGKRMFGISRDRKVFAIDSQLKAKRWGKRLRRPIVDIHVTTNGLLVLDEAMTISNVTEVTTEEFALLTEEPGLRAVAQVRRAGDTLWAATAKHLYSSEDAGKHWQRRARFAFAVVGLMARSPSELFLWGERGALVFSSNKLHRVPAFGKDSVVDVIRDDKGWLAFAVRGKDTRAYFSSDRGASWIRVDTWRGQRVRHAYAADGHVMLWSSANRFRKLRWQDGSYKAVAIVAPTKPMLGRGNSVSYRFPCCTALYMADKNNGYLRGYVHHMGDHYLSTVDGGLTWQPSSKNEFPAIQVVPYRDGALAVAGYSFGDDSINRRELYWLQGQDSKLIFAAPEYISSVSIDLKGRILLELDSEPDTLDDFGGRRWVELRP